jgi:hypothetical protein
LLVVVVTLAALVGVLLVPPAVDLYDPQAWPPQEPRPGVEAGWIRYSFPPDMRIVPVWQLPDTVIGHVGEKELTTPPRQIHWPLVFLLWALVLLLGGGLLTFVVRRERRRELES